MQLFEGGSLSEDEENELDEFLISASASTGCLNFEGLDGLLAAVAIGPELILPSEWLPLVWDDGEGPEYGSMEQAERIMSLIMRHMNSIASTLHSYPEEYAPIIDTSENAEHFYIEGAVWAHNFMRGTELRLEQWKELTTDDEHVDMIMPIMTLLATEEDGEFYQLVDSMAKRTRFIDMVPDAVMEIHEFWLERREQSVPPSTIKKQKKVGRNEPCPCASGKKYKKCCGAPDKLH